MLQVGVSSLPPCYFSGVMQLGSLAAYSTRIQRGELICSANSSSQNRSPVILLQPLIRIIPFPTIPCLHEELLLFRVRYALPFPELLTGFLLQLSLRSANSDFLPQNCSEVCVYST